MQLKIMHMVKNGELSIDGALDQARRDKLQLLQRGFDLEVKWQVLYILYISVETVFASLS